MFFFIGGVQPRTVRLDKRPRLCPQCGHNKLYLKRVDHYLSLFFIPLFPVKKGVAFLSCDNCGSVFDREGKAEREPFTGTLRKCPYCGRQLETDFEFCPRCGKKVPPSSS